jgi:catechol 2,3-dioxygenase-like lactoylglutathione lyase family enzyme
VTVLASAELVAFVPVADLGRARAFYETVLGMPCVDASGNACVFDCNGTTLRVTLVPDFTPSKYTILGFYVDDVRRAKAELEERGVRFKAYEGYDADADGIWTAPNGRMVTWFEDPDGNIISLSQPVRA